MPEDDFVFDWTKKLGFKKNPFQSEIPQPIDDFFAGYGEERKDLNYFVLEKHPFGTISGEEGTGKTTVLKWIKSQLKNHKDKVRVAYINASELNKERDLIKGLTLPLMNVYEKNVAKKQEKLRLEKVGKFIYSKLEESQRLLILIDDVGGLPERYLSLFKYFYKNKIGVQIIAAGTEKEIRESNIRHVHEKDWLDISLDGLEYENMKDLLHKRIKNYGQEGIFPFQEEMVESLYQKTEGNPKNFLKECREKAVKLALDKDYIEKEREKVEEEKRKRREEEGGLISITLGGSDEEAEEEKDELFEMMQAPDEEEQKEIIDEIEEKDSVSEEEMGEVLEEASEEAESEVKEKKKSKEAEDTEELLEQLTKDFEEE